MFSNFDVHQLLSDIITMNFGAQRKKLVGRGLSLFEPLPPGRSFRDAYIAKNFCVCLVERNESQLIPNYNETREDHEQVRDSCSPSSEILRGTQDLAQRSRVRVLCQRREDAGRLPPQLHTTLRVVGLVLVFAPIADPPPCSSKGVLRETELLHQLRTSCRHDTVPRLCLSSLSGTLCECICRFLP